MHGTQLNPVGEARPKFCAGRKVTETHKALLWQLRNDDPHCPSRLVLHTITATPVQISVTLRHIKRLRKTWGLNRGKGRPRRTGLQKKSDSQGPLGQVTSRLAGVGVHVFGHWLDQQQAFAPVVAQLTQAIEA